MDCRRRSGFAHDFRPIEGEAPPLTPSQPGERFPSGQAVFASLAGTPSQRDAWDGAVGEEMGLRKRRRFPGPLAFLNSASETGVGGSAWGKAPISQSTSVRDREGSDIGNGGRSGDNSAGDGEELDGGHFSKGPWLKLCDLLDAPLPKEGATNAEGQHFLVSITALQVFLIGFGTTIAGVLAGDFDLRVPTVTAVIDSVSKPSDSDLVAVLVDPSGRMEGYFHPLSLEDHGSDLTAGAALVLKEISLWVSGPGTKRSLNIHPDTILAIFAADTPPPSAARLEALRDWSGDSPDPMFKPVAPKISDLACTQGLRASGQPSPWRGDRDGIATKEVHFSSSTSSTVDGAQMFGDQGGTPRQHLNQGQSQGHVGSILGVGGSQDHGSREREGQSNKSQQPQDEVQGLNQGQGLRQETWQRTVEEKMLRLGQGVEDGQSHVSRPVGDGVGGRDLEVETRPPEVTRAPADNTGRGRDFSTGTRQVSEGCGDSRSVGCTMLSRDQFTPIMTHERFGRRSPSHADVDGEDMGPPPSSSIWGSLENLDCDVSSSDDEKYLIRHRQKQIRNVGSESTLSLEPSRPLLYAGTVAPAGRDLGLDRVGADKVVHTTLSMISQQPVTTTGGSMGGIPSSVVDSMGSNAQGAAENTTLNATGDVAVGVQHVEKTAPVLSPGTVRVQCETASTTETTVGTGLDVVAMPRSNLTSVGDTFSEKDGQGANAAPPSEGGNIFLRGTSMLLEGDDLLDSLLDEDDL
ncbi:unnamed protein product [Choristocarpus tenellus]